MDNIITGFKELKENVYYESLSEDKRGLLNKGIIFCFNEREFSASIRFATYAKLNSSKDFSDEFDEIEEIINLGENSKNLLVDRYCINKYYGDHEFKLCDPVNKKSILVNTQDLDNLYAKMKDVINLSKRFDIKMNSYDRILPYDISMIIVKTKDPKYLVGDIIKFQYLIEFNIISLTVKRGNSTDIKMLSSNEYLKLIKDTFIVKSDPESTRERVAKYQNQINFYNKILEDLKSVGY
jgi:hypothetical protein